MGTVFQAENTVTGKQVAVKWMHPHVSNNRDATERLLREARATSRLSHPNVVDVYDVVQDDQTLFLVMELLHGETLRSYLRREPNPKVHEFIGLLLPALAGVAAAHEHGVIHRDLKPDNIFLARVAGSRIPAIKVLDFGIAKLTAMHGMTLTETGVTLGTPLYMSLEQLRGDKNVDARADVYAFGVMLYEGLTGKLPYSATTLPELAIRVATTDPAPVKSLRPDLPTALARLVDWSIARDRAQRLPNVQTLFHELEVFARETSFREHMTDAGAPLPHLARGESTAHAEELPTGVIRRGDTIEAHETPDTLTAREVAARGRTRSRMRSRSLWIGLVAVAAIGVVGIVGAYFWLPGASSHPSAGVHPTTGTVPSERAPAITVSAALASPASPPPTAADAPDQRRADAHEPAVAAVPPPPTAANEVVAERAAAERSNAVSKAKSAQPAAPKRASVTHPTPTSRPSPAPASPNAGDGTDTDSSARPPAKRTAAEILAF